MTKKPPSDAARDPNALASLNALSERNRDIFRTLVETYLETGDPVGSRTLSRQIENRLSAASIRNVMQDLELMGLLSAPHTSAGRMPTQTGLRLFVDGLLQLGDISSDERRRIESALTFESREMPEMLDEAGTVLSGLSRCASLVFAPKGDAPIKHIEAVPISDRQGLFILVMEDGTVENRLFDRPPGLTPSAMVEASNFLNAHMRGRTLAEARAILMERIEAARHELDALTTKLIEQGVAEWSGGGRDTLIIRGRSNLLEDVAGEELELVRQLFDDLERQNDLAQLLELAREGEGVRVFIGSENKLFSLSGSSLVISPYMNAERKVVGAIGVIGPTRLNYARVVPIVDYTARVIGRLVATGRNEDTETNA